MKVLHKFCILKCPAGDLHSDTVKCTFTRKRESEHTNITMIPCQLLWVRHLITLSISSTDFSIKRRLKWLAFLYECKYLNQKLAANGQKQDVIRQWHNINNIFLNRQLSCPIWMLTMWHCQEQLLSSLTSDGPDVATGRILSTALHLRAEGCDVPWELYLFHTLLCNIYPSTLFLEKKKII